MSGSSSIGRGPVTFMVFDADVALYGISVSSLTRNIRLLP
jgi:guanylate kinase